MNAPLMTSPSRYSGPRLTRCNPASDAEHTTTWVTIVLAAKAAAMTVRKPTL